MKGKFISKCISLLCITALTLTTTATAFAATDGNIAKDDIIIKEEVFVINQNTDDADIVNYIQSIEDKEIRDLLIEYWTTPTYIVSEDSQSNNTMSRSMVNEEPNMNSIMENIKDMAQMSTDELTAIVRDVRIKSEKVKEDLKNIKPFTLDTKSISQTRASMPREKWGLRINNPQGALAFEHYTTINWQVSSGKITYIAPTTTVNYSSYYRYWGKDKSNPNVSSDKTYATVNKKASFSVSTDDQGTPEWRITNWGTFYGKGYCSTDKSYTTHYW
ncbi:hypothetical protein [Anaerovorax odorimutans]|uniref:hypothetical protein n=1 Tax=Anaerovorax odorimutans TaxID=109327 RepID=UPI000414B9F7|nr:hypothetical protein [Anaerovorax odorimutans]